MEEHHLEIRKTARYFQHGELNSSTKEIWIVCHGYGQLANFFLRKFESLAQPDRCIIAPEGLHRYYQEGSSGRVVASWMTKEDRLNDIRDYVAYLDQVADLCKSKAPSAKLIILGFSQGCATVSRWVSMGDVKCDALILYAGVFPPDLNFEINGEKLKHTQVIIANGNEDEFLSESDVRGQLETLKAHNIHPFYLPFSGKHQIYPEVLELIRKKVS